MPHPLSHNATGSKRKDILVFLLILSAMLFVSPVLRVYFHVLSIAVDGVYISEKGQRLKLKTPTKFKRAGTALPAMTQKRALQKLEGHLRRFTQRSGMKDAMKPGSRLEWTLRHSYNSVDHDQIRIVIIEKESGND